MRKHVETSRAELLIPEWPAPSQIGACFSTRDGGVSLPPWDSLNLGDHVGDDPERVRENRRRLEAHLPTVPRYLRQVHGIAVADLDHCTSPIDTEPPEADAALSAAAGTVCLIGVADCLPVLFTDRQGTAVAAAHAGWRGLSGGVLEATLSALCQRTSCTPQDVLAWLGPCIGPDAFEVGPDVLAGFGRSGETALFCSNPPAADGSPRWLADLAALARLRLIDAGMNAVDLHGNDSSPDWCTVTQSDRFFSHRRASHRGLPATGRMAAAIWIKPALPLANPPQDS